MAGFLIGAGVVIIVAGIGGALIAQAVNDWTDLE